MRVKTVIVFLMSACVPLTVLADSSPCQQKFANIEQQIEQAKKHGNPHRVKGLERALHNAKSNCSTRSLIDDKKEDIVEQEEKITDLTKKIQEKTQSGKVEKVKTLERELQEEQEKLTILQRDLRHLEQ